MTNILSDDDFSLFSKKIYDESGILFSAMNRSILDSRLRECLKEKNISDIKEYYTLITQNKEEMKYLLDLVTTNLTYFFRNQPQFDTLEKIIIPQILEEKKASGNSKIRVWSAGCSTGEEPYTLAMMLKNILPPPYTFEVVASDLSLKSLMVGKQGFYPKQRTEGIPPDYLQKYFIQTSDGYQVTDEIMKLVQFDYHNLMNDSGLRNLDLVFCRNVLIYFDETSQTTVVNRFWDAMGQKSYLFIGHSESLWGLDTKFEFLKTDIACLYAKKA